LSADLDTAALWRAHQAQVRGFIARRVRRNEAVDDVLQEVFMKAHAALPSLRSGGNVAAWLFRIAANAIVDHHRRESTQPASAELGDELPEDLARPPAERDPVRELALSIEPLLAALPSPYREAVRMADLENLPQAQIAQAMGITLSGAKSRVQRGREKLHALMHACCDITQGPNGITDYAPRDAGCACGIPHAELLRLLDALTVYRSTAP
jgi:RNA polymerase sigma-70 factor, ECF subfamily